MGHEQPWDVYRAVWPLYLASRIFGLAPVRYVRAEGVTGLRVSWAAVAYAALLSVGLLVTATLYLTRVSIELYGDELDTKLVLTDVLGTLLMHGSVLGAITANTLLHRRRLGALLAAVAAVDRALVDDRNTLYRRTQRVFIGQLGAVSLILIAYVAYESWDDNRNFTDTTSWFFYCFFLIFFVFSTVSSTVLDAQFIFMVQMLRERFCHVNSYFEALLNECQVRNRHGDPFLEITYQETRKNCSIADVDIELEERPDVTGPVLLDELVIRRVFSDVFYGNKPPREAVEGTGNELCQPPGLNTLFRVHDSLCDAVDKVNACFGFQVLLELTCLFVDTVCSLYYAIRHGLGDYMHWLLLDVMKIVALAAFGHRCTAAANSTAPIISRLLLEPASSRARRLLARFSQQLLHARAVLCAGGLLVVSGPLLAQMAGLVATYIVILVQYKTPAAVNVSLTTTTPAVITPATLETTTPAFTTLPTL